MDVSTTAPYPQKRLYATLRHGLSAHTVILLGRSPIMLD